MIPIANGVVAKQSVDLLKKRLAGRISEKEFYRELAYLLISEESFRELVPDPEPVMPTEIMTLRSFSKDKQNVKPEFWNQEHILKYTTELVRVRNSNRSKTEWLLEALNHIPEEDIINRQMIEDRISQFRAYVDIKTEHTHKSHRLDILNER